MITSNQNILDIVQLPEISKEDKQLTILSTDEVVIDDFISFNMSTKGSLYQRNMKYCEVVLSGKYELTSKWINIKRFIASDLVDNGNLQEIDYGDFGVLKSEYDDTTQRTKLICYDRMLQAQIPYDSEVMNLTYPMTVSQVLNRLAIVCKLDLVVNTVNNLYQVIHSDLWANQSFTYADVLDHIAQATTSIISIRNNKLEIFNPIENDFTIQGKFYSLKIGESYGKTNIVNVSQEPQHYNKFAPSNALDIPLEDRKELAFSNNPILNQDMQTWADRLYLQTKDLEYATFESSTIGYGIFEVGDMVDVYEAGEDVIHRVMITNETFDFKHALTTEIGSNMPMVHKNQYVVETDQARQGQTTYLIVDQLNGVIEALVQKVDDEADKTAQLRIDVDSIELQVENIGNGNILPNGSGELGYYGYTGGSDLVYTDDLVYQDYMTYSHGFIPKKMLGSLSEWGLSFINSGYDITPSAYVVPNTQYAYKAKVNRFKPFSIQLLEFKNVEDSENLVIHKSTTHTFNNPMQYVSFTQDLDVETQFTRIRYNRTGVTYLDRLEITEVMFNRGIPSEWQQSATNAMIYSQTTRTQLSDRITDTVTSLDKLSGDIHNTTVDVTASEGVVIYNNNGKGLTVLNDDNQEVISLDSSGNVKSYKMTAVDMIAENIVATGNITATSGKIGGFDINGTTLQGLLIAIKPSQIDFLTSNITVERIMHSGTLYTDEIVFNMGSGKIRFFTENVSNRSQVVSDSLVSDSLSSKTPNGNITINSNMVPSTSGLTNLGQTNRKFGNVFSSNAYLDYISSSRVDSELFYNGSTMNVQTGAGNINIQPFSGLTYHRGLFLASETNRYDLGNATYRWRNIYLNNQPNVSSDTRYKSDIQDIDPLLVETIGREVKPKQYRTQFDDKIHFGYIAQDVERALYKYCGHDKDKYAMLSKDESYMSLLYGELNVIMDSYNRSVNNQLEERIKVLEGALNGK